MAEDSETTILPQRVARVHLFQSRKTKIDDPRALNVSKRPLQVREETGETVEAPKRRNVNRLWCIGHQNGSILAGVFSRRSRLNHVFACDLLQRRLPAKLT